MSEYIEYVFWAMFTFLGLGTGWLIWGRGEETVVPPTTLRPIAQPTQIRTWSGASPAPFRVVTLDGDVRYEGESGAGARRMIEYLRSESIEWRAYRGGQVWDWGPR